MASGQPSPLLHYLHRLSPPVARTDRELLERFTATRDEAAFAELVGRHGELVLTVCRQMLRREQDAEDAFQATFLVLARKAGSICNRESLAGWLYGVAWRTAAGLRADLAARRRHEGRVSPPGSAGPPDLSWGEVQEALHEELAHLPEKYRAPLILCYLEGQTQCAAARQLGWGEAVLRGRVDRGRERLRQRLARRGITPSAALLATAVLPGAPASEALSRATARLAVAAVAPAGSRTLARLKFVALILATAAAVSTFGYRLAVGERGPQEVLAAAAAPDGGRAPRVDRHGDPLPDDALVRLGTLRWRHGDQVLALAYSPDGKLLASGSMDESIHLRETKTGRLLHVLRGHEAWVDSVFFTPDGKQVISCGQDQTARVWDVATGKERRRWKTKGGWKMALSLDGKTLAGMGVFPERAAIFLWDVATGGKVRELPFKDSQDLAFDLAFSPDGKRLVSGGRMLRLFDVAGGKQLGVFGRGSRISSLAFSPDGKVLAVGRAGQRVALWDTTTLREIRQLDSDVTGARAVAFAPDGKTLAVAGYGPAALWDPATGKKLRDLPGKLYQVWSVTFSPDGKTLAVGNLDSAIHLYDPATGKGLPASLEGHQEWFSFLAFADRGRSLLSVGTNGLVRHWNLGTARPTREQREEGTYSYCGALSPDGRTLAMGDGQRVRLVDRATGKTLHRLKGHTFAVRQLAFSPGGDRLASVADGGGVEAVLILWDVATGKELRRIAAPHRLQVSGLAWSPGGKVLASGGATGGPQGRIVDNICLWDPDTGRRLREWIAHPWGQRDSSRGMKAIAFSPDGALLASAGADRTIGLWDAATGALRTRLLGHQGVVTAVLFSPDGRMLASGGNDRTVRLWELATGKQRQCREGHLGGVWKLAFSADGRKLASGSSDTSVVVWAVLGTEARQRPEEVLSKRRLGELWGDLAGEDAARAWQAACTLAAAPKQTLDWVQENLKAPPTGEARRMARLVEDLDSDQFAVRRQAAQELEKLGELAEKALRKVLEGQPGAEVRRRAKQLLAKLDGPVQAGPVLRGLRVIEVLEHIGTAEARRQLERLAREAPCRRLEQEAKAARERLGKRTGERRESTE